MLFTLEYSLATLKDEVWADRVPVMVQRLVEALLLGKNGHSLMIFDS